MKMFHGFLVPMIVCLIVAPGYGQEKSIGVSQELQEKINKAIENGVKWLKQQQQANGSFEPASTQFPGGRTALAMLTLLRCGVPRDDDSIKKGFEWLKKSSLFAPEENSKNYCVCILILALEALNNTTDAVEKGTSASGGKLKGDEKEWMKRLHKWLIDHRREYEADAVIDQGKGTGGGGQKVTNVAWGYPGDPVMGKGDWIDHSNTQFSALALGACSRVGIQTPDTIWFGLTNHFLTQQEKDGKKIKRVGVDTDKGTTVEVEDEDRARGWTYTMPTATVQSSFPKTSYASMTCIGVASLCLCRAELQKNSTYKRFFSKPVEAAIRDGIAWLGDKFPVKDRESKSLFYYYTLYGLERVGALAKIVNIGSHLWYKEGAEDILSAQKPDGSWDTWDPTGGKEGGAMQETCFCLLFLSNATFKVPGKGFQIETGKGAKKDK